MFNGGAAQQYFVQQEGNQSAEKWFYSGAWAHPLIRAFTEITCERKTRSPHSGFDSHSCQVRRRIQIQFFPASRWRGFTQREMLVKLYWYEKVHLVHAVRGGSFLLLYESWSFCFSGMNRLCCIELSPPLTHRQSFSHQ